MTLSLCTTTDKGDKDHVVSPVLIRDGVLLAVVDARPETIAFPERAEDEVGGVSSRLRRRGVQEERRDDEGSNGGGDGHDLVLGAVVPAVDSLLETPVAVPERVADEGGGVSSRLRRRKVQEDRKKDDGTEERRKRKRRRRLRPDAAS